MQFVTRAQWGAPPTTPAADMPTAKGVKVHWIGGPYTTPDHAQCAAEVRAIRSEHLSDPKQGWVDIAYNLLICGHGFVFEGRGIRRESGANGDQPLNLAHYAVCAIVGTAEADSPALLQGIGDAIGYLRANGAGPEVLGHRDGYNTDCPGDALYALVHSGRWSTTPAPGPTPAPGATPPPPGPAYAGRVLVDYTEGGDVRAWQTYMHDVRRWTGLTVDGEYGQQSAAVCAAFQRDSTAHGYPLKADGEAGPKTWQVMLTRPITLP